MDTQPSIPVASFHTLVDGIVKNTASPFALQIGAMDGVKFDLLHQHLIRGGWRGLLVEPVPDMFAALQNTYKNQPQITLVKCAIGSHDGTMQLKRVNPQAVAEGIVPEEALGITTSPDSMGLLNNPRLFQGYPRLRPEHILEFSVDCLTLASLLGRHQVEHIDLVMIDTEGADWMIAKQIDLGRYRPRLICLEHTSLPDGDKLACIAHFMQNGYRGFLCQEDPENFLFAKDAV